MHPMLEPFSSKSTFRKIELLTYLAVWVCAVAYAIYEFFLFSQDQREYVRESSHVYRSWLYRRSLQDRGDFEWMYWKIGNFRCIAALVGRSLLYNFSKWPAKMFVVYDLAACVIVIGLGGTIIQITLGATFFLVSLLKRPILAWVLAVAFCALRYMDPGPNPFSGQDTFDHYRVECTTCYFVVRCISFAYDYANDKALQKQPIRETLYHFTRYAFFFPLMWTGPITPFSQFLVKSANPKSMTKAEVILFINRIVTSAAMYELVTHFLYPFSVRSMIAYLNGYMSRWAIAGICYTLGQVFQLKYMVLFGACSFFSKLNGVDAVQFPICIGWTHRYSLMWKYFDHGLYVFLRQYIYIPFAKRRCGKLVSSLGCYAFVLFWHGMTMHMFCWVGLNWIALFLEGTLYEKVKNARLRAALNAPIFFISIISNMFFLGESFVFGKAVYNAVLVYNTWRNIIGILFVFYCCSTVGDVFEVMKYKKTEEKPLPEVYTEKGAGDTKTVSDNMKYDPSGEEKLKAT